MTRVVSLSALVLAACVAGPELRGQATVSPELPGTSSVLQTRLDPPHAMVRVRERLDFVGFDIPLPADRAPGEALVGSEEGLLRLSRASTDLAARESTVRETASLDACWGESEIVQARAVPRPDGTELHLRCHTERLVAEEGACIRQARTGCPTRGDRLIGELTLDLARR